jgi:ketosteroid isomerase-like protein
VTDHDAVLQAAADLVAAFGSHQTDQYFDSFAPDATMLFHNVERLLTSRDEYRREWQEWEASGFHVLSCVSRDQHVQVVGDVAVFTHRVATRVEDNDGVHDSDERETVVFRRSDGGRWLVIHEHLSLG